MRTTVTIDPDVAAELERRRRERGTGLKEELNYLLRAGLAHDRAATRPREPYRPRTLRAGTPLRDNVDNVAEVLAELEGEDFK